MHSPKVLMYSAIVAWSASLIAGYLWTINYGFATYKASNNFQQSGWPQGSSLILADNRPTLLLFLHPKCPCTRASIRELERILTGQGLTPQQRPKLIAVATLAPDAPDEWRHTDTITSALQLPNASIAWDVDGTESHRFGAVTSSTVMLYLPNGNRLFAGGITASRGHEGDNAGSDRVLDVLSQHDQTPKVSTPAFGCRLCFADSKRDFPSAGGTSIGAASAGGGGEQQ